MKINEYKLNYIDKEAFELVNLLSISEVKTKPAKKLETGSLSEQKPILTLNNVTSMVGRQGSRINETIGNKSIGFDEKSGKRFQKFVLTIHDDPNVNTLISLTFIESKAWQWLLKTKQNSKADSNFSSYILSEMENAIEVNSFYFPIVCMDIEIPFKIGCAEFGYFTSDYFKKFIDGFSRHQPDKKNPYLEIQEEYKGMVYVAATVSGEPKRAKEIALEICSLSMDILKICSNVLHFPEIRMDFDIDSRSQFNPQNEVIVESPDVLKGLTLNLHRPAHPYLLDKSQLEHIRNRKLEIFNDFILGLSSHRTELEKLIIQGIKQFANSLTNTNYFRRVAELYTVLESLMYPSDQVHLFGGGLLANKVSLFPVVRE